MLYIKSTFIAQKLSLPPRFFVLRQPRKPLRYCARFLITKTLNSELCRKALEKVGNPNVLINLVSRRVRQLNSGGGPMSRPLLADTANMGAADIALLEIIEGKMGWEMPEMEDAMRPRKRSKINRPTVKLPRAA